MNRDNTGYTGPITRFNGTGYVPPPYFQVADGHFYSSFTDNGSGGRLYTGEMDIDHTNWSDALRSGPSGERHRLELHVVKDKIYYVYMAEPTGTWNVYTAFMNTDGTGWTTTQRTNYSKTTDRRTEGHVHFRVAGNKAYYCWSYPDETSTWQIWTAEMDLDGTNWVATQRTTGAPSKWRPELQIIGDKIYYMYWEGSSSWSAQAIATAEMGSNIVNKGASYGLGMNVNRRISAFVNDDWMEPLYNGDDNSSVGQSVFGNLDDQWNYVVMTYDRDYVKLYINGELAGQGPLNDSMRANAWDLIIGDDFNGTIDEVKISDRALTATEIKNNYGLTAGTYYWRVSADDGNKTETMSETRSFSLIGPDVPALISPADGITVSTATPLFVWSSTAGTGGDYTFEYALDSFFTTGVVTVDALTDTTYTPSTMADNTYYWHVQATDSEENSSGYQSHPYELNVLTGGAAPQISLVSPPEDSVTLDNSMELEVSVTDPESNPMTIWIYGDTADASDLLYLRENASSPTSITYNWNAPVLQAEGGTVGLWHFDENSGTSAADATTYGHDGTITGATWTTGKFGAALDFDGDSDFVHVAHTSDLAIAGPLTIEAWVNPRSFNTGATGYNVISRKGDDSFVNFIIRSHDSAPSFEMHTDVGTYEAVGLASDWSTGSWCYLVGVWDGSYTRLYVNGVQIDSVAGSGTPLTDTEILSIGDKPEGGAEWDGLIDEVRYTNGALTSAQIASNYRLEQAQYSWKVRAYDGINDTTTSVAHFLIGSDTQPPTITLNSPQNDSSTTNPYMQLNATVDDNVSDAALVRIYGDTISPPARMIYEETVPLSSPTSVVTNWGETELEVRPSTVGLWRFNEGTGTAAADASSYGNDGTISGAVWTTGKYDQALDFDGSNDYVEIPSSSSLQLTEGFTVEAWVYAEAWTSSVMVIARKGTPNINYLLRKDGDNLPSFQVHSTTTNDNYALGSSSDWGPDAWYYVAGVWEGDSIKIYVNGVLAGADAASGTPLVDNNVLHIGDNSVGGAQWDGIIDEVRISDKALTADEIAANYTLESDRYYWRVWASDGDNEDSSEVRYFDVGIPVNDPPEITLLSPPQDSSTTNSYMDLSAQVDDPEGDPMTVWIYGDGDDASDLLYVETDVADPSTINYSWTAPVLSLETGTLGLWHFDEGSGGTVYDASTYGHDGSIAGATWTTDGRFGYALDFDGSNDYVEIPDSPDLRLTGDFSVEAWVRADEWPSGVMVILRKGTADSINYLLRKDGDGLPSFQVKSTTTDSNFALGSATDWGPDEWYYVVGTWNGSEVNIYVNGELAGTGPASGTPLTDTEVLHIGDNTQGSAQWNGLIDEVRISPRELSAEEIENNYQLGVGTYYWKVAADDGVTKTLAESETRSFVIESEVNYPPSVTLLSPPDDSTSTVPHMELSAQVDDLNGDPLTVYFYGDQDPNPTTLLYQESGVTVPSTINYDWIGDAQEFGVQGSTVGLWHMNENTGATVSDATSYNHDGTITGATWTTGMFGSALDFDGDGDFVEVTSTAELTIAGPMTVEAWVNPRSYNPGTSGYNVIARKGSDDYTNFILRAHDSSPSFEIHTDVGSYEAIGTTSDWTTGSWYYLAGVWDGSYLRLYVNGEQIDSIAGSGTPLTDSEIFIIGDRPTGGSEWDGLIDEVRYTDGALTSEEIADTYRLEYGTYYWKVAADDGAKVLTTSETRQFHIGAATGTVALLPSYQETETTDVDTIMINFDDNIDGLEAATFKISYDENYITPTEIIDGPELPSSNFINYTIYPEDSIVIYIGIMEGYFDGPGSLAGIVFTSDAAVATTWLDFIESTLRDTANQDIVHTTEAAAVHIEQGDLTPPTIEVTAPASGNTYNYLPTLTINVNDDLGIDRGYYQIDACTGTWTEFWSYNSAQTDTSFDWTVPSVAEGGHSIYFKAVDDIGNVNADTCTYSWDFTYDIQAPSPPTNFTVLPGHEKCKLSWTNPTGDPGFAGVEIRRNPWNVGAYPEYDDDYPTPLGYPADETEGDLVYQGTAESYRDSADVGTMPRNVYYYSIFSYDAAGNYSAASTALQGRASNYWLGDASGDGNVYFEDLMVLSNTFWLLDGQPNYNAEFDIGPTYTGSPAGIPETDNVINFEDLVIFAINFGEVGPNQKQVPLFTDTHVDGALGLTLQTSSMTPAVNEEFTVNVKLDNNTGEVKCIHFELLFDGDALEYVGAEQSPALKISPVPVFFAERENEGKVEVSLALLGNGLSIGGSGELVELHFRLKKPGQLSFGFENIDLRDTENQVLLSGSSGSEYVIGNRVPSRYALGQNYPNPFNPNTEISYELPEAAHVTLKIYNVRGQLVRMLVDEFEEAGYHKVMWDSNDDSGQRVSSGIYLYRMESSDFVATRKMVLMK